MKVGFVGLGKMGRPMTLNLLKAGFEVTINNRSQGVVQELAAEGATPAASPRAVADAAEIVLTCLPTTETVEHVYTGADGLLPAARSGQILIDHSTVSPISVDASPIRRPLPARGFSTRRSVAVPPARRPLR